MLVKLNWVQGFVYMHGHGMLDCLFLCSSILNPDGFSARRNADRAAQMLVCSIAGLISARTAAICQCKPLKLSNVKAWNARLHITVQLKFVHACDCIPIM